MERYSRQTLYPEIGEDGQKKLLKSKVTIIGCGALGCCVANNLARAGIGDILIVDRDFVELNNLQRQLLFDERDLEKPKALAAEEKVSKINSEIKVKGIVDDVNYRNVEEFVLGRDLVLDGTDNMETRFLINDACRKHEIPWIYGGAISSYGMTANLLPQGFCFRCIFPNIPKPSSLPTCDTIGVLNTIPLLIASIQSTETIKILLEKKNLNKGLLIFDVWDLSFDLVEVKRNLECQCCSKKNFEFLEGKIKSKVTSLCGRNAVQINPLKKGEIHFDEISKKLEKSGEVKITPYILFFKINEFEVSIFRDGRAIVKGTEDEKLAISLYSKYVGI